jgi:hypothetical protein
MGREQPRFGAVPLAFPRVAELSETGIGFPAYQGNNREIRRSGRAYHRIYVEKTVYLSYFQSNSLRNRTGN